MSRTKERKHQEMTKAQRDNRSNQLNPNNRAYWLSRGYVFLEEDEERCRRRSSALIAARSLEPGGYAGSGSFCYCP